VRGCRPTLQSLQHPRGWTFDGEPADERADGDTRNASTLQGGPDPFNGQDGADRDERIARRDEDQIRLVQRVEHAGRGLCIRRTCEADAVDRVAMRACDEPLLEGEAPVRCIEPRAQLFVRRRENGGLHTEDGGKSRCHG